MTEISGMCCLYITGIPLMLRHLKKLRSVLERFGTLEVLEQVGDDDTYVAKYTVPQNAIVAKEVLETFNCDATVKAPHFRVGWLSDKAVDAKLRAAAEKAKAEKLAEEKRTAAMRVCVLENMFRPQEEQQQAGEGWQDALADDIRSQLGALKVDRILVDDWTELGRAFIVFHDEMGAQETRRTLHGRQFGPRRVDATVISIGQLEKAEAKRKVAALGGGRVV